MNKAPTTKELVAEIAANVGMPEGKVRSVMDMAFRVIAQKLGAGRPVRIIDFGTFRPALGRRTVHLPGSSLTFVRDKRNRRTVHFRPARALRG